MTSSNPLAPATADLGDRINAVGTAAVGVKTDTAVEGVATNEAGAATVIGATVVDAAAKAAAEADDAGVATAAAHGTDALALALIGSTSTGVALVVELQLSWAAGALAATVPTEGAEPNLGTLGVVTNAGAAAVAVTVDTAGAAGTVGTTGTVARFPPRTMLPRLQGLRRSPKAAPSPGNAASQTESGVGEADARRDRCLVCCGCRC